MQAVVIAGGGIGGLTLGLALAQYGIASHILESRPAPPREGAGIQLGPNATRILQTLGLEQALAACAVTPGCIVVNDGVSGRQLTRLPLGDDIATRHGAPYWVVHRADLLHALWQAATAEPAITIESNHTVAGVADGRSPDASSIQLTNGDLIDGPVVVGADGLWSQIRSHVDDGVSLTYSGVSAARALVPIERLEQIDTRLSKPVTGVWMAPNAHVVHYPVAGGEKLALIAIGTCPEPPDGWNSSVGDDVIRQRFQGLPDAVRGLLAEAESWRQWPLYHAGPVQRMVKGRAVLIGDAAHPILPFLAQGGALAIEDAYLLAQAIDRGRDRLDSALQDFEAARLPRVAKVQAASVANGRAYHLSGIAAAARNTALRALPAAIFMRRYDWIYGFRA